MTKKALKNKNSFETDLKRLEEIVSKLELGLPIEEALELYREGIVITDSLEIRLTDIERKVFEVKNIDKLVKEEEKELDLGLFK